MAELTDSIQTQTQVFLILAFLSVQGSPVEAKMILKISHSFPPTQMFVVVKQSQPIQFDGRRFMAHSMIKCIYLRYYAEIVFFKYAMRF